MRTILIMIRKEFQQIFRDKQMLPVIFLMPVIQLLILVQASTFEIKNVNVVVIDDDFSTASIQLKDKFSGAKCFTIVNSTNSEHEANENILKNEAKMILRIPKDFEKDILINGKPKLQIVINSVDALAAGVIQSYCSQIIFSFYQETITEFKILPQTGQGAIFNINERYWYNPELNYKQYMVPGILGILVTIIAFFLSGLNIVREKEIGTIEQLNVTPIKKYQFIVGKLLPFLIIALFELAFGLTIAKMVYEVSILGNLFLIFGLASIYLLVILAGGLLISTFTNNQQQSMFITFFFIVILILMSGLFTPVESMPKWAQVISFLDPFSHFVEILRRVMLKGAGFMEVQTQAIILSINALIMISAAVFRYRKVSS